MIQVNQLDSHTKIIMETVDSTETVSIGFWFLSGSRDEPPGYQGYTHFLEHMLFKGTKKRSAFRIAQEIDRVGGILNAFTEKENTCYYCILPGGQLSIAVDVLSDMIFHSILDPVEIEKEKTVVINEILSVEDSPEEIGQDIFLEKLWKDHPLSLKITGEVEDIQNITKDKLENFYRNYHLNSSLIIAAAGKFQPDVLQDQLKDVLQKRRKPYFVPQRSNVLANRDISFVKDKFQQVQIYAGFQMPGIHDLKTFYELLIVSTIIGESMSSRLFQKIREDMGLCYSIYSFRMYFSDVVLWLVHASAACEFVTPLLDALNSEFKTLKEKHITQDELKDAISHLKGNLIMSAEDMESRMKRLVRLTQLSGRPINLEESFKYINEVKLSDINSFVDRLFVSDNFNLLTYGNKKRISWKGFCFNF